MTAAMIFIQDVLILPEVRLDRIEELHAMADELRPCWIAR